MTIASESGGRAVAVSDAAGAVIVTARLCSCVPGRIRPVTSLAETTMPSSAIVSVSRGAERFGDIIHAAIKVPAAAPSTSEVRIAGASADGVAAIRDWTHTLPAAV
jgi:hypothetical protein